MTPLTATMVRPAVSPPAARPAASPAVSPPPNASMSPSPSPRPATMQGALLTGSVKVVPASAPVVSGSLRALAGSGRYSRQGSINRLPATMPVSLSGLTPVSTGELTPASTRRLVSQGDLTLMSQGDSTPATVRGQLLSQGELTPATLTGILGMGDVTPMSTRGRAMSPGNSMPGTTRGPPTSLYSELQYLKVALQTERELRMALEKKLAQRFEDIDNKMNSIAEAVGAGSRVVYAGEKKPETTMIEVDKVDAPGRAAERDPSVGSATRRTSSIGSATRRASTPTTARMLAAAPAVERDVSVGSATQRTRTSTPIGARMMSAVPLQPVIRPATPTVIRPATPTVVRPAAVTEIDKVDALGRVVERDFIVKQPSPLPVRRASAPTTVVGGVVAQAANPVFTEIDKKDSSGHVVERDLVVGAGGTRVLLAHVALVESRGNVKVNHQTGHVDLVRSINFVPRQRWQDQPTAVFQDAEVANEICRDIAEICKIFNAPMTIEGHTKGGESHYWQELSDNRASAVVELVESYGVPEKLITARGRPGNKGHNEMKTVVFMDLSDVEIVEPERSVTEVDKVDAFGRVIERDFVVSSGSRKMNAFGQVRHESPTGTRVLTPTPTAVRSAGMTEIDKVDAFGRVVERDFVSTPIAGVTEIDKVDAFGRLIERDFVTTPGSVRTARTRSTSPRARSVGSTPISPVRMQEFDKVNSKGQVVERDLVVGAGGARVLLAHVRQIEARGNIRVNQETGHVDFLNKLTFQPHKAKEHKAVFQNAEVANDICRDLAEMCKIFNAPMIVEGHAKGGEGYVGQQLADNRACCVVEVIKSHGAPPDLITARGRTGNKFKSETNAVVIYMDLSNIEIVEPETIEIDKVNAFGQVVERDFVLGGSRKMHAFGHHNKQQHRVISAPPPVVRPGTVEIDKVDAFGRVVERDFVSTAPTPFMRPGTVEIDKVDAFGRVVERDFVSSVPTPIMRPGTVEIDKVDAFGRVVERDFVSSVPTPVMRPGTVEIDKVDAFGRVVERDFLRTAPAVMMAPDRLSRTWH